MNPLKIAASILSADFSRLGEQITQAIEAGTDYIHIDVMDGHFVPNMTVGPLVVAAVSPICRSHHIPLDVHLMIEQPDRFITAFAEAGADLLTVHVETCPHLHRTLQLIRDQGIKVGVTLNPATSLSHLDEVLPYVDQVLIMSVNPGYPGQRFIAESAARIRKLRRTLDERGLTAVDIEVDGGLHVGNVGEIVASGANVLVAGSAIFNTKASIHQNLIALRRAGEAWLPEHKP